MTRKKTELVMFDLGRVLIDFDFKLAIRNLKRYTPLNEEEIHQFFRTTPLWDAFEKGQLCRHDFFAELAKGLQLSGLPFETFEPLWNNIFQEIPDTIEFFHDLRKRYRTALVSNVNVMHWEFIRGRHAFLDHFDFLIPSYAVGMRKPGTEIYRHTLKKAGVAPEQSVFTDDVEEHITAARSIGIDAVQFTSAAQLKKDWAHLL